VGILHDLGKAYTQEVTSEGKVRFYGHAEKSVEIAEHFLEKVRKENADLAELILSLVRYHDHFLSLINIRSQEQTGGKTRYLNKFMREALYTKGHLDKLLMFAKADGARSRKLQETLSGIEDVLGDIQKAEQKAKAVSEAKERLQQRVRQHESEIRALLEPVSPEAVAKLPNLREVNKELAKLKRLDLIKEIERLVGR
jgi:CRISPR/Cas system-associated endonuclease Cas3-HD